MNEPKRHHYIPQFILRNFCFDSEHIYYYDKNTEETTVKEPKDVFMSLNLYRDEINHPKNPTAIEKDFARFECEMSEIINGHFFKETDVIITKEDQEKLMLFLALMGFRSKTTSDTFGDHSTEENRQFYSVYQKNGDLSDLWKRNLGILVNCRSFKEIIDNPDIDDPVKAFMQRDIYGYFGRYFSVVECREPYEFVIGDAYPTAVFAELTNGNRIEMYYIFPISPKRVILSVCVGVEGAPMYARKIRECVFQPPYEVDDEKVKFKTRKLYDEETSFINEMIIKSSNTGYVYRTQI